jgi:phytoene/squalene synthetase
MNVETRDAASSKDETASLAQSITRTGSKQAYHIARLMVDKDLVSDFYRAYAYFRWADDIIDVSSRSSDERISFIKRQRELIDCLYRNERPDDLIPEEEIIADLISHDRADRSHPGEPSGLESFIHNMFAVIEFDAHRKGRLISQQELMRYSDWLSKSVTDGIQYFIGNGHPYPVTEGRYLAATAAHITHLLRDMLPDTADGFINISREYLEAHSIGPEDVGSAAFRAWVRGRVDQARQYFRDGGRYIDELDVLRCKIAASWYCARFEGILDVIERDGYVLRAVYNERSKPSTWVRMTCLAVSVTLRHFARELGHLLKPRPYWKRRDTKHRKA